MDRLAIRSITAELPAFHPDTNLTDLTALNGTDVVSDFRYRDADLRSLELEKIRLLSGRIEHVRAGRAEFTVVRADSIEFTGCDLSSLTWSDSKLTRVRFTNCKLLGAHLTDLTLEHVVFSDCELDYSSLTHIKNTGPVIFSGCALTEARFEACDLSKTLLDACALNSTGFERGTYRGADLRGNDLSTIRGVTHLAGVHLEHRQILPLAEALALDLGISFEVD
jgi:uncharacterized protein YjbI with pentapeptide repeats